MGCVELDNPGAQSLIDGITKCARAGFNSDDLSTEKLDAENIKSLTSYIFL